ncbi:hypothetical protein [Pseudoalteromonas sp. MelDa3]|uniref:hypothetical protein n=1 Tax=Pseudoalteromonas sp. MelDa3 TaxID=888435 RepID=UPI000CA9E093|nr:hypothetical protein [Pseudoalteromonas sp. MelDa3]PLT24961.1 hypothetical protein CXF89_12930 [Pseudoalteromonas sp. MelDa3]
MIEFINVYWAWVLIATIIIVTNVLNLTVFKDVEVRPIKDHIEEGWGRSLDEGTNKNQQKRRDTSTRFMWFLCLIVVVLSIIF